MPLYNQSAPVNLFLRHSSGNVSLPNSNYAGTFDATNIMSLAGFTADVNIGNTFDQANNRIVIPATGSYFCSFILRAASSNNFKLGLMLLRQGVYSNLLVMTDTNGSGSTENYISLNNTLALQAGDMLYLGGAIFSSPATMSYSAPTVGWGIFAYNTQIALSLIE